MTASSRLPFGDDMDCILYNFNKRINSTKIVGVEGVPVVVKYKESVDTHNPVITFSAVDASLYNYAKIGDKYYYVDSCVSLRNNIWELTLRIDLLATYRNEILNTKAYISRATKKYNAYLYDSLNSPSSKNNYTVYSESGTGIYDTGEGCFILQVLNSLTNNYLNAYQAAYILTASQVQQIARILMTDGGIIAELKELFNSPLECIVKLMWLPLNYNVVAQQTGALSTTVYLGAFDTEMSAYLVGSSLINHQYELSINASNSDNYLSGQQYNNLIANIPFVGVVPLDGSQIIDSRKYSMTFRISVDARTGKQLVTVCDKDNPNHVYNAFESIIGVDCALGNAFTDISHVLNNVAMSIPIVISGHNPAFLVPSLASSVSESTRTIYNTLGTTGGNAFLGFATNIRVIHIMRDYAFDANSVVDTLGLPLNAVDLLSNCLGGYCITRNASVNANAYYSELSEINNLLDGGVYLE